MRLFQIIDIETGRPVPDLYFTDKAKAKAERRRLNSKPGEPETPPLRFIVSPGPDHHKLRRQVK